VTENLRSVNPIHARALVSAALALGFVATSARVIALFGSFPPRPWVYLLLAVTILASGVPAIILAGAAFRRNVGRWAIIAIVLGAAPTIELIVQFSWGVVVAWGLGVDGSQPKKGPSWRSTLGGVREPRGVHAGASGPSVAATSLIGGCDDR
jgi:hypothetical protein